MSTPGTKPSLEAALVLVPAPLRGKLIRIYADLKTAVLENRYESIGLRAGRLSEILLRVLQHRLTNAFVPIGDHLNNFGDECEKLGKLPKTAGPDSLRILVPRALTFLYTLRNKRDIGHVGGDVDANAIDALAAAQIADWCMCELIRVVHKMPLEDAQALCHAITERRLPQIWNVLGKKRVLDATLNYRDQTLLLLYAELDVGVPVEDLFNWTEHPNWSNYRRDVLKKLHDGRLIEWDRDTDMALISPTGSQEVDQMLLPRLA